MNVTPHTHAADPTPIAGGQTQRLPGTSRDAALHDQLYRYAEDLQQMMERQSALEAHYENLREVCARLDESRSMLDELIRSSQDIHIVTDSEGVILQTNPAVAGFIEASRLTGSNLSDWIVPDYRANYEALRARGLDPHGSREDWELQLRHEMPGHTPLIVSARVLPIVRNGRIGNLHWTMRDVTHLRETEFETQLSSMVFRNAAEGVMITDVEGEILAVNPAFSRITGYRPEEVIGRNPRFLKSGLQDASFYNEFWRALAENGRWQGEIYNRKKNGEIYPEWMTVSAARDNSGRILSYIAVFSDLSRLLQAEKRLAYLAHYDTLTDLPNRLLFNDRLTQTLTQAHRNGQPFTVIFIDLDRFKHINDTLGHEIGDRVLQAAARRISSVLREGDTVARLGGDEFVILAPGLAATDDIGMVCGKAIAALTRPILIDNQELAIGASLGCAIYPLHGEDDATLMKLADMAMYRAKNIGGSRYFIHGEEDAAAAHALPNPTGGSA